MKHRSKLACALFACVMSTLPACALFTPDAEEDPGKQGTVEGGDDKKASYLQTGPTTKVDISPGQKSLLQALKEAQDGLHDVERDRDELRNQLRSTQMRLEEAEAKLGNSTSQKSALDAELDAAQARLRDLEARLLDAALEKAKLQKQALDLEIAAVRGKLDTIRRAEDQ